VLILSANTDSISLTRTTAENIACVCSFIDRDQTTGDVGLAGRELHALAAIATTDVVAPPTSGTTRNVTSMSFRNTSLSLSNTITVNLDLNGTLYELYKCELLVGEVLEYIEGIGFVKHLANSTRTVYTSGTTLSSNGDAWKDIAGLTVPVKSGLVYGFVASLIARTNATTTGAQFAVNLGSAPTVLRFGGINSVTPSGTAAVKVSDSQTVRDTAHVACTTGPGATDDWSMLSGYFQPSVDDIFAIRMRCEQVASATMTAQIGCWLTVFKRTG
jgi:hypothetical protein